MTRGGFHESRGREGQTPVFILEQGVLGHRHLLTHFEGYFLGEGGCNDAQDPQDEVESNQEAEEARRRQVHAQFLQQHVCEQTASESGEQQRRLLTPTLFDKGCLQGLRLGSEFTASLRQPGRWKGNKIIQRRLKQYLAGLTRE